MAATGGGGRELLGACHGFRVMAEDGLVGEVETPLFPRDSRDPDYLVIRASRPFARRRIVSVALVTGVDPDREVVLVRGSAREIASLPEHLPLFP